MYIPDEKNIASVGRSFRRGALEVLGMINGVTPVATFTGMPQLPPEQSSEVCRHPLPMPPLDLDLITKDIEDLKLPRSRNSDFLQDFKEAASEQVLREALKNCMKLCPFIIPSSYDEDINAVELLMGVKETARHVQDMVVVGSLVTTSLKRLLTSAVPGFFIYSLGRDSPNIC